MVDGWTAAQIREAERPHLEAGEPLMQRAALGLAAVVRDLLGAGRAARVLLLVGSGNNGADTLYAGEVLAREFVPRGGRVTVVPVGSRVHEAALAAAVAAGATVADVEPWCDPGTSLLGLREHDVVLDGLVGTGSTGVGLRGDARRVVHALLTALAAPGAVPVVAVDVPSGIGTDDGSLPDPPLVLPATVTVTFGGYKAGLLLAPASALAGRLVLVDIGIGADLAQMPPATP